MKKWKSVIAFDVLMVIFIVLLVVYGSNLPIVATVIAGALIAYETVKVNSRAILTTIAAKRITEGQEDVPVEDIKRMLGEYQKTSVVGTYAKHGIAELESAERKREKLYEEIGKKFSEGSLTWMKFVEVVDAASNAIAHNTALLARRIQSFDVEDYNRTSRNTITGLFSRNTIPDDIKQEKRQVYELSLNDMRGIVAANERLLVELERFGIEMGQLETSASAEKNDRLLEEVNTLVEETKYYQ